MKWVWSVVAALVVGVGVTVGSYAIAAADDETTADVRGPGTETVVITVHNSRFRPANLRVWEGTQVRFEVRNRDPINHELVVGSESVHRRHENGGEATHPPVPGEVSLGPGQTGATVYEFDDPGTYRVVCHLPRHEEYGMVGEVEVLDRPDGREGP
jgi:uncharacterized cupredoxin-like copper-binding protein